MQHRTLFLSGFVLFVLLSFPLINSGRASLEMWSQSYGGKYDDRAYSLVEASDGGYAIAGSTRTFLTGSVDFWLVKTDAYGNMEWNQTYGEGAAHSLVKKSDGGYALAGNRRLVKTDGYGNMEWNQTYGGAGHDHAYSLVEASDGGYAIAGETYSFGAGDYDFWLVKTDGYGNMEWNQTYGGAGHDHAYSLVEASDGGFALAGFTSSFGGANADFWLVKTDGYGNMEWNQTYDAGEGWAYSLVETSDGGYAIAGDMHSTDAGIIYDAFLVKTDEHGIIPEFPSWIILPLLITATLVIIICKQRLPKTPSK